MHTYKATPEEQKTGITVSHSSGFVELEFAQECIALGLTVEQAEHLVVNLKIKIEEAKRFVENN